MGIDIAAKQTDLCVLAEKYGTDKLGFYTPIYDLLLSGRRDSVSRVLEVGIGTPETMRHVKGYKSGASLRMWRDYFPNAIIYGIDSNIEAVKETADERIATFFGDSTTGLPWFGERRFDLIIDDGSHEPKDQLETFNMLSPLLRPNGIYIIEDVGNPVLLDCEHTYLSHIVKRKGTGRAILIRQEALDAV